MCVRRAGRRRLWRPPPWHRLVRSDRHAYHLHFYGVGGWLRAPTAAAMGGRALRLRASFRAAVSPFFSPHPTPQPAKLVDTHTPHSTTMPRALLQAATVAALLALAAGAAVPPAAPRLGKREKEREAWSHGVRTQPSTANTHTHAFPTQVHPSAPSPWPRAPTRPRAAAMRPTRLGQPLSPTPTAGWRRPTRPKSKLVSVVVCVWGGWRGEFRGRVMAEAGVLAGW